jgi:hypothetical protein
MSAHRSRQPWKKEVLGWMAKNLSLDEKVFAVKRFGAVPGHKPSFDGIADAYELYVRRERRESIKLHARV